MAFDSLIIQGLSLSERQRHVVNVLRPPISSQLIDSCKLRFSRNSWLRFMKESGLRHVDLRGLAHATAIRSSSLPPWTLVLKNLMTHLRNGGSQQHNGYSFARNLARPVVHFAWRGLSVNLSPCLQRLLSPVAQSALRKSLDRRLEWTVKSVADWECQVFREKCLVETIEAQLFRLLQQYPALARMWSQQVRSWIEFVTDFLDHAKDFSRRKTADRIESIVPDMSDPREGNRTVLRVHFRRGGLWYYKPRSGEAECGWSSLLDWFNRSGFTEHFKTLNIISQKDHCWMKRVGGRSCRSGKEAGSFFFRSGALLYVIHLLRGCDFHAGNLIAQGTQPVVIDCETLRHPDTVLPKSAQKHERDVLRTGLLPIRGRSSDSFEDVSAFGRSIAGPHRLCYAGRPVFARDYLEELVSGFTVMHKFIRKRECEFRAAAEKFLPAYCRCLHRPTAYYRAILESSLTPGLLVNGLARSLFLHAACRNGSIVHTHAEQEVAALENADTPQFVCRACSIRRVPSRAALAKSLTLIRHALRKPPRGDG